ncbi:centrosomal and chromosomal factor [Lutzomyia longipalpis]|uniref:Centrosomal and chromosomal factor n=1 Tax=Lutzomyia longipalpis TaxID=7200 RepID=A0A1B0CRS2_LUTLO|nr:centrosomal and chromosomal factor [Lutzomyia longipalpis]
MAMAACYGNYDLSGQGVSQHHQQQQQQTHQSTRLSGGPPPPQKDYSIPLHVDCSVEYELPNAAKPPAGARVEPLLMIHPCYFRKMESQRRSPFINNMPNSSRNATTAAGSVITGTAPAVAAATVTRRSTRTSQVSQHHHTQQHHHSQQQHLQHQLAQQIQQQQMSQMSQQAQYPVASNGQQAGTAANSQYIEQARRAVIHSHTGQQQQQTSQQQQQPQVQNGGAATSWNHMTTVASTASMSGLVGIPGSVNMTGQSMYSKPVGKRDAMLSGGCGMYSSATNDNLTSGRWEPERSPMAAIPRDYQAGPDATPVIAPRNDDKHILSGKYRQYLRAHRLHPYMMATGSVSSSFPQLTASAFPQMQQVTCYNV